MFLFRRWFFVSFLALWLFGCLMPTPAAASAGNPLTHLTAARIYAGPDRSSLPVGLVENGQPLQVVTRTGDFLQIQCYGLTVYIHREQVVQTSPVRCYVNCSAFSPDTQSVTGLKPLELEQLRQRILKRAYSQLGSPYVYGGQEPGGFDCSGLMEYVFHYSGFYIPRTADAQLSWGIAVSRDELLPGDLVFFNNPEESDEFITHVGLYIGEGSFLHASVNGGVCIRSLKTGYFADHFVCARRVLNPGAYVIPSYDYFTLN